MCSHVVILQLFVLTLTHLVLLTTFQHFSGILISILDTLTFDELLHMRVIKSSCLWTTTSHYLFIVCFFYWSALTSAIALLEKHGSFLRASVSVLMVFVLSFPPWVVRLLAVFHLAHKYCMQTHITLTHTLASAPSALTSRLPFIIGQWYYRVWNWDGWRTFTYWNEKYCVEILDNLSLNCTSLYVSFLLTYISLQMWSVWSKNNNATVY